MKNYLYKYRLKIVLIALGAIAGILYWKFIGCASGSCPITSHWYSSGAYGMIFGWLISDLFKNNSKKTINDEAQ